MNPAEPTSTAVLLSVVGALLAASTMLSRASVITGVPAIMLFLVAGILAGSEGFGGIHFADYHLAFRAGTVALVLILFDGGLNTSRDLVRRAWGPAFVLASIGVIGTAAVVALGASLFGFSWSEAFLLGAIVSSTDAAAIFSILRGGNTQLRRRIAATLELESGLNDPVAVIFTIVLSVSLVEQRDLFSDLGFGLSLQLGIGSALGILLGYIARWLLKVLGFAVQGLYPVFTLSLAFLAFSLPTLLLGSGFLAVYLAGVVLGNGPLPYRTSILRTHDFLAWFSQVSMFLILGLLVFPSQLIPIAGTGTGIALLLTFVARPVAVLLCLTPFRYSPAEQLCIGWAGLRGAVPIVLATFPLLIGVEAGHKIFNIVFFVVVVSIVFQGASIRWLGRRLRVERPAPPLPSATIELSAKSPPKTEILSFFIDPALAVSGARISDLAIPTESSVVLIVRGDDLLAPRGDTVIQPGDHVYILCRLEDHPLVQLLFGSQEED